ncbi:MAG: hypothetical protein ACRC62_13990 [Microcoleus sp.]
MDTSSASASPAARRVPPPVKRTMQKPSVEELTPKPIGGTAAIRAELEGALAPVLQEISDGEYNAAARVVNALIPRIIQARSAQSEQRIADHVRDMAGEVAIDAIGNFPGVFASNQTAINSMADVLFDELCQV